MSHRHDILTSYVPWLLIDSLARNPTRRTQPSCERLDAAVLVADISGFTALTETLVQQGPIGVEELSITLNAYVGQLIELVISHGGDIVEFTGDGILVLWPTHTTNEDLATVTYRAAQCGRAAQQMLALQQTDEAPRLSIRIGIGTGTVLIATVGGLLGRWELLVAGDPITQASRAEGNAQPGEVVLSAQSWGLVQSWCIGYPVGYATVQAAEVGSTRPIVYTHPAHHTAMCPITEMRLEDTRRYLDPTPLPAKLPCPDVLDVLRSYVPAALVARLDAGQSDWVAELRRVTILFVNLHGIDYDAPDILEQVQSCIHVLQTILYRYEGSLNQFIVDDKGTLLIAALGLPPLTHEDDAARGVHLALDIQQELHTTTNLRCAIGITTGRIFSGSRGSVHRRDYAMIGDSMNLAARLMVNAAPDGILCDAATYNAARNHLTFEALTPIKVHGKSLPVEVYRPYDQPSPAMCSTTPFVGRAAEQTMLTERIDNLYREGTGGVIVIEGEAGMGKSRLVNCMLQYVQHMPIVPLIGHADSMEQSSPYHIWRAVFSQLFGLDDSYLQAGGIHSTSAFELIHYDSMCMQLAPLLSTVLPLDIPDNHITSHMSGQVRADNTRNVLVRLLRVASRHAALLIVLEDANWMDSASWALALAASQKIPSLLLVITTRPLTSSATGNALLQAHMELEMARDHRSRQPHTQKAHHTQSNHTVLSVQHSMVATKPLGPTHNYDHVLKKLNAHRITLTSLPADDMRTLIAQSLGVHDVAQSVTSFIVEKAQGNPFFAQELAYGLRDAGLIVLDNGICQPASDSERLDTVNFPITLHGVIVSRIDRLSAPQQLLLKIASVIGDTFDFGVLYDIYPLVEDRVRLLDELQKLETLDVIVLKVPAPELVYGFKHVIMRQVVYDMLLFGQRRDVHRAVAEWYERHYADNLSQWSERLMYHWGEVGDSFRELVYATRAGEYALQNFAREEAVQFLLRARALFQKIAGPPYTPEHNGNLPITIEKLLGEAYLGLGKLRESRQHLEQAATLAGYPIPSHRVALLAQICGQVLIQSLHYVRGKKPCRCSGYHDYVIQEAAHIYGVLFRINFLTNDVLPTVHAALRCLNIAENSPQTEWQCYANANMCSIAGSAGLHHLAHWYGRRALQIGWQQGDIPALTYALNMNGLYRIGIGDWRGARGALEQGLLFCTHMEDWTLWGLNYILLAQTMYFQGHFATSYMMARELYTRAQQRDNVLHHVWARVSMGQSALRLGKHNEARAILEEAVNTMTVHTERPGVITSYGLLAMTRLALGDTQGARDAAQTASRLIADIPIPFAHRLLEGYAGVAEVYLAWYEECGVNAPPEVIAQAHTACRNLQVYAQSLPIGRPRAYVLRGWCAWLDGMHDTAFVLWRKGLSVAHQLGMPYEEGVAHTMIGRHSQGAPRVYHLNRARDVFHRLGVQ